MEAIDSQSRAAWRRGREPVGVAIHTVGSGEYRWVYLETGEYPSRYTEVAGDDKIYSSKDAALIAAYLAFRKRLRATTMSL